MSARQLLEQLLQSGQGLVSDASARVQSATSGGKSSSFLGGLGGGILGGGALGLLLGNKKVRKVGSKVAMVGGLAALGALAYRAYGDWQKNQAAAPVAGTPVAAPTPALSAEAFQQLPVVQLEQHSNAVLTAMIGAAKADGHIGPDERKILETELAKLSTDPDDRRWLEAELARPLDPANIAAAAKSPEMGVEMYLASLVMVDEESFMERAYLDELARQLNLAPDLKAQLESQVKALV